VWVGGFMCKGGGGILALAVRKDFRNNEVAGLVFFFALLM